MNSSAVGRSDFGGTKSKKDIYNFHEVKIAQGSRGRCKPAKWGLGEAPEVLQFLINLDQHSGLNNFKIDRINRRKIKYWKDFSQQNRSSSSFIKKGHINMGKCCLGETCPLCPPVLAVLNKTNKNYFCTTAIMSRVISDEVFFFQEILLFIPVVHYQTSYLKHCTKK